MIVFIPSPLRSYTNNKAKIQASGSTLATVLRDVDAQYPGFRFRIINEQDQIRRHIRIFVNTKQTDTLELALGPEDQVHIICALSGG